MKNYTILLVLLFALGSCGTRKKIVDSSKEKTEYQNDVQTEQTTESATKTESSVNLSEYLHNVGLKITSTGSDYELKIGDLAFKGNANVEFSKQTESRIVKTFYQTITNYRTHDTYKSHTQFWTVKHHRFVDVKSNKPMFWLYAVCGIVGFGLCLLLQSAWKTAKKSTWYGNVLNFINKRK